MSSNEELQAYFNTIKTTYDGESDYLAGYLESWDKASNLLSLEESPKMLRIVVTLLAGDFVARSKAGLRTPAFWEGYSEVVEILKRQLTRTETIDKKIH